MAPEEQKILADIIASAKVIAPDLGVLDLARILIASGSQLLAEELGEPKAWEYLRQYAAGVAELARVAAHPPLRPME